MGCAKAKVTPQLPKPRTISGTKNRNSRTFSDFWEKMNLKESVSISLLTSVVEGETKDSETFCILSCESLKPFILM